MCGKGSSGLLDRSWLSLLPASGPLHVLFLRLEQISRCLHCFLPHFF